MHRALLIVLGLLAAPLVVVPAHGADGPAPSGAVSPAGDDDTVPPSSRPLLRSAGARRRPGPRAPLDLRARTGVLRAGSAASEGGTGGRADGAVEVVDGLPERGDLVGGRYLLGDVVGCGSSAVVHRAEDVRSGAVVAVKVFTTSGSVVQRSQHRREIEALSRLQHPGLVRLLDGDGSGTHPFVVTELVEGPSLAEVLHDGPLTPAEVHRLGAGLAAALGHVHAHGFVHRDVKPSNVLLDGDRPRLVDFGIARAPDGTVVTATGASVGTAAYMAPEQVRGRTVSAAADVYALALVLIEALTGRREYPGSAVESAVARLHRPPVVPDGLPRPLRRALTAMTRLDPDRRPTAAAVAEQLGADPPRTPALPVRRRLVAAVAAVVAGVVLVASTGLLGPGPGRAPAPAAAPPVGGAVPVPGGPGPLATEFGGPTGGAPGAVPDPPVPAGAVGGGSEPAADDPAAGSSDGERRPSTDRPPAGGAGTDPTAGAADAGSGPTAGGGDPVAPPAAPDPARTVQVPQLTGLTSGDAADALVAAGLDMLVITTVPDGRVGFQDPGAGVTVSAGTTVEVRIQ